MSSSGYNRDAFAVRSKSELLDYIEQQTEQISRLETRFRDVVRAYRGVLKEKEALEASLSVLNTSQREEEEEDEEEELEKKDGEREEGEGEGEKEVEEEEEEEGKGGGEGESKSEAEESDTSTTTDTSKKEKGSSDASLVSSLRQQLATLTTSLQTLTVERAKNETNFQRDKKNMLVQQEAMAKQHQMVLRQMESDLEKMQLTLRESQASLKTERVSREEEQATHADMLRELQSLISSERDGKEALGLQIQEMDKEMLRMKSRLNEQRNTRDKEVDEVTQSLSIQVSNLQAQLQLAEKRSSQPPPELIQLQREMERVKEEHEKEMKMELQRSCDLEERLKLQSAREEQQTGSLENKVSQLSETVGGYVLLRDQDQVSIQKLKERITQLDQENTKLTREHIERRDESSQAAGHLASQQDKIARLRTFLKLATSKITEKASLPSNIEDMAVAEYRDLIGRDTAGKQYQQELVQLREEFEKYKTRAQTVLRSKENKDTTTVDDQRKNTESIQNRLLELREQVRLLRSEKEEGEERHLVATQKLREEIRDIADRNRAEVVAIETLHKEKLHDLHRHVQTTRDRTVKLLSEKDAEIDHLRGELASLRSQFHSNSGLERSLSHISTSSTRSESHHEGMENGDMESSITTPSRHRHINLSTKSTESLSAVQEILEQPSPGPTATNKEPQLLHFLQEQQKRESELANVRRKKFELEDTLRDLQEREQRHLEQGIFLKEQIRKLERDRSRETESMEYLKNIVFHFMCSDSFGRDQLVSPIATILHFSPDEVKLIRDKAASRRWIPRHS